MLAGGKAPEYDGGAKSAECALCPIKCGLLKQTVGPRPVWVHTVCALWQGPEVTVLPADRPDAVRATLRTFIAVPSVLFEYRLCHRDAAS